LPVLPYGEVTRFGGFEEGGKKLGKFVYPVGFAVAPEEGDAVYVLDRVTSIEEVQSGLLQYRLQKLSSTGEPLGSVTLPLQEFTDHEEFSNANPLMSLAVDSQEHRVYALVEGMVDSGSGLHVPVVQRLVAWSTDPVNEDLVKASGAYSEDSLTHAALIAGESVLEPADVSKDLYAPEGIVVAPNHDVVIEAQEGVSEAQGGPTILQSVTTTAPEGKLAEKWVAEGTVAPTSLQADGLFTTTGGFGVDLFEKPGGISRLASVNAGLTAASSLAEDASGGKNFDEAATIDDRYTVNYDSNHGGPSNNELTVRPYTAGSPVAQLTNGFYAARYGHAANVGALDGQSKVMPWNEGGTLPDLWTLGSPSDEGVGNVGIRLFEAVSGPAKVVTTIGGEGPCKLETGQLSVAAGEKESVFVLTEPNEEDGDVGDEVIEFAPGGSGACPQPSGQVKVNGVKASSVSVNQGVPVQFDASSIDRENETPFSFEWSFEGEPYVLTSEMTTPEFLWPSPTTEHTYETPGEYDTSVRVNGDFGASVFTVKVKVASPIGPVAKINAPSAITAGQLATFSAAESTPSPGSSIVEYHWEFGDGSSSNTAGAQVTHTYASAGPETVKLKVTDAIERTAEASASITVAAEKASGGGGTTSGGGGTTSGGGGSPSGGGSTVIPPVVVPPGAASARVASAVTSSGVVTVTISCPTGNTTCSGTVTLQTAAAVASAHGKRARLLLSKASFDLAGGKQEVMHLHVSSKGLALLRKTHSLRALATITTLPGSGRAQVTAAGNVTLRATKGAHRH
jgi:hypothetical protein